MLHHQMKHREESWKYEWWNTVLNAWYYLLNKKILEREIKDAKMNSFSSISKHSLNILDFLCIFIMT